MTERDPGAAVRQFVEGTMPLAVFVRLVHRDLPLREHLASGGGLEGYAQADLLGRLLRTAWQDVAAVRQTQQLLERFLRDQGVVVDPTGLYQDRVDSHEKVRSLLTGLQPPWLKIPAPYAARLLEECGDQVDGDVADRMRRQIASRFRYRAHPPQWLHEEYWPVGRHGPLVFVDQVDAVPDRPGTAVNYVFVDSRSGALLVLPQTRPDLVAEDVSPASPEVRIPRGVVPVLARPGAFWLAPPDVRHRPERDGQASGRADDGPTVMPAEGDAPTGSTPVQQPSDPQTEPIPGATPGPASPSVPVDPPPSAQQLPADQPAVQPVVESPVPVDPPAPVPLAVESPVPVDPPASVPLAVESPVPVDPPAPVPLAVESPAPVDPPASVPLAADPPAPGPAVPTTLPVELPAVPSEDDDLEATAAKALPSFQPWTLVLADGRTFSVESRSLIVGRRPRTDEQGAQVLAITDPTRSLSKTHARLELMGDTWHVTDLGSTNGVVVTAADGQETKVEPGQPSPVYSYVVFGSVEARLQPDPTG